MLHELALFRASCTLIGACCRFDVTVKRKNQDASWTMWWQDERSCLLVLSWWTGTTFLIICRPLVIAKATILLFTSPSSDGVVSTSVCVLQQWPNMTVFCKVRSYFQVADGAQPQWGGWKRVTKDRCFFNNKPLAMFFQALVHHHNKDKGIVGFMELFKNPNLPQKTFIIYFLWFATSVVHKTIGCLTRKRRDRSSCTSPLGNVRLFMEWFRNSWLKLWNSLP